MTVGVAPRQSELFTGQRRFAGTWVDERSICSVLRRECHRLFPGEMFAASTAPPPFAAIRSCRQTALAATSTVAGT
jgi:hypothetical protein